jgi:hypothetical protein
VDIQLTWADDARTVILWAWRDNTTLGEFGEACDRLRQMAREAPHGYYYLIVDSSQLSNPPVGLLTQFPALARSMSDRLRLVAAVGVRDMTRALAEIFARSYGRLRIVGTLEDARALVAAEKRVG